MGISSDTPERVSELIKSGADVIVVDTAHGHSFGVIDMVKKLKKEFNIDIIAGNVATAEATIDLIKAGADCIKVGIGAGSICTTRIIAGVGVPQMSAVIECYSAARKFNIPIISDGGVKQTEIFQSNCRRADAVMLGGLFAGTEEAPGEKYFMKAEVIKFTVEWPRLKP